MSVVLPALCLLGAILAISFGIVRIFSWVLDRRDARIDADYRAARLVAVARAEVRRG